MVMFAFVLTPAPANFFFRSASWTTSFTRCGRPGPIWSIPTLKRSLIPLKRTGTGTTRKFRWALSVRRRRTTWERRTRRAARQLPLRRREKTSKRAQSWRRRERDAVSRNASCNHGEKQFTKESKWKRWSYRRLRSIYGSLWLNFAAKLRVPKSWQLN